MSQGGVRAPTGRRASRRLAVQAGCGAGLLAARRRAAGLAAWGRPPFHAGHVLPRNLKRRAGGGAAARRRNRDAASPLPARGRAGEAGAAQARRAPRLGRVPRTRTGCGVTRLAHLGVGARGRAGWAGAQGRRGRGEKLRPGRGRGAQQKSRGRTFRPLL
jgi:hypothetical protein